MSEFIPPYGALPYYQTHFIVAGNGRLFEDRLIARTRKKTKGVIRKEVVDLRWEGGRIAERLNSDSNLKSLLTTVLLEEGDIYIDPTENGIRIYGSWKPEYKVEMSKQALEAYDIVAGHVKRYVSELIGS
ncbi:MAG: hypothetical protein ACRD5H_02030 [Nitrososphaerales archaeon]